MSECGAGLLAVGLLGREVCGCTENRADLRDAGLLCGLRDAEVGELGGARIRRDQEVARLDVAMHHAGAVRVVQPVTGVGDDPHRLIHVHQAPVAQEVGAGRAIDVFHDDEVAVGRLVAARVVDLDHVRVLKAGGGQGLAPEAGDERLVVGQVLGEELDRDLALEHVIAGEEDGGHATGAQAALEACSGRPRVWAVLISRHPPRRSPLGGFGGLGAFAGLGLVLPRRELLGSSPGGLRLRLGIVSVGAVSSVSVSSVTVSSVTVSNVVVVSVASVVGAGSVAVLDRQHVEPGDARSISAWRVLGDAAGRPRPGRELVDRLGSVVVHSFASKRRRRPRSGPEALGLVAAGSSRRRARSPPGPRPTPDAAANAQSGSRAARVRVAVTARSKAGRPVRRAGRRP